MTLNVPASAVDNPGYVFAAYNNWDSRPEGLLTFSGVIACSFETGDLTHNTVRSFLPKGGDHHLIDFSGHDGLPVQFHASIASIGSFYSNTSEGDALGATDRTWVRFQHQDFGGGRTGWVPILAVDVAALHTNLLRIPYLVTIQLLANGDRGILLKILESDLDPGGTIPADT
ncbi:hypothetical protein AB0469_40230 [Streptomyces sp. NPDC093801]|uniref:hypothetical protein n=1 Tax=Streptomyces sp. NPDC093801 TaxID=3155203 RepID=UPI00344BC8B3